MPRRNRANRAKLPSRKGPIRKKRPVLSVSHRPSTTARRTPAIQRYPGLRTFQLYNSLISNQGKATSNWLEGLWRYGSMALHAIAYLLASPPPRTSGSSSSKIDDEQANLDASNYAMVGTSQGFLIGADDLLINTPIMEVDGATRALMTDFRVDYQQARVMRMTVTLSPGAELSRRAGRYVMAAVPLTYEQAQTYLSGVGTHRVIKNQEICDFDTLLQYPGAVTCSADKPTKLSVGLTGYSGAWHMIGQPHTGSDSSTFAGGLPLVKILFGYQDMSANKYDNAALYSADEALFQLDIQGSIALREPGTRYIRCTPLKLMSPDAVSVSDEKHFFSKRRYRQVPRERFTFDGNTLQLGALEGMMIE